MSDRDPYAREKVLEAVEALGSPTTNVTVRDWILKEYPDTNQNTIQAQIIACTVNHPSRIHFAENKTPRLATDERYDFLYRPERGKLELYDPDRHGAWRIVEEEDGDLSVAPAQDAGDAEIAAGAAFAAEDHLRDYLAQNLEVLDEDLEIYIDEDGVTGVEYTTPIGRVDILAVDGEGFVVIELKVGRSPDSVAAQVLRYVEWVRRNLAPDRSVRGYVLSHRISDRVRYALASHPEIELREYELSMALKEVPGIDRG